MYWSHWDTAILWTGILTALLAILPVRSFGVRGRLLAILIGAIFIVSSIISGNTRVLTYPAIVEVMWIGPLIAAAVILVRAWLLSPSSAEPETAPGSGMSSHEQSEQAASGGARPEPSGAAVSVHPLAGEARDPATPLSRLASLAETVPELRPLIAANPSTYPGLLEWLSVHGDDAVQRALRERI